MNLTWSLKELYESFNCDQFKNDMKKCDKLIENFNKWVGSHSKEESDTVKVLEDYIKMESELYNTTFKIASYAQLILSVDSKNETALKNLEIVEQKLTVTAESEAKFEKWIGNIKNLDSVIEKSNLLKEHKFYLKEKSEKSKYLLGDKEEVIIAKMKNTGSNAWSKLRDLVTSTLSVDININGEDKKLPLTVIRNMAYDGNKNIRKTAYEAELNCYKKIEDIVAACLNGIKGEVITVNEMRGYKSPLEETLINSRMDKESLNAMLEAMKESMPAFRNFYKRKAEILGEKNGLHFYNLFAPVGSVDMKFTYEEARDFIVENFRTFSDKLAEYALKAFNNNWIDAEPREGKVGGAFCENLHVIGESRIMSNFSGNFSDVVTLAHELGHGYHGSCLVEESVLNSDYPMPIAETASTFCETIIQHAAIKKASKEEAFTILESSISDCAQVTVDIYSRYIFETKLFEARKTSSLSSEELKNLMLTAQKEAYGHGLDEQYLHPYMWLNKPHYYSADESFYNFPYAFGLLFAKGLYAEYLKRPESFVEDYDKLLSITGKNKIADITKLMGIDIHSIEFWRSSLKSIEEDIQKFMDISKQS